MNDSLENKTYLIAGGSKGIGLALTQQMLASGAIVHVFSRTSGELPESDRLTPYTCDYICDFFRDDFESAQLPVSIHGMAHSPGTNNLRSFRGLKLEDFRNDFEVNTMGAVKFLKGCLVGLSRNTN